MLSGIAVALVLAGGGATAYVLAFHQPAAPHAKPLPSRAITVQSVGLVVAGTATGAASVNLLQLINNHAAPEFSQLSAAQAAAGSPQWTADLMGDNTYIFIFLATNACLSAVGPSTRPHLALRHCDLAAQQRWRRTSSAVLKAGHDYYQYANSADGKCLTMTGRQADGDYGISLAPCATGHPASQLIAFWWVSL